MSIRLDQSVYDRIYAKSVAGPNCCIVCTYKPTGSGYSVIKVRGKQFEVHRLILEQKIGREPKLALHTCIGNKLCINPHHLYDGDYVDNERDKIEQGRKNTPYGEGHYRAKLSYDLADKIRREYDTGDYTQTELGVKYGVDRGQISRVINGQAWVRK